MFSSLDSKSHAERKRILANIFSKSFLHNNEDLERQAREILHGRLLPLLESAATSHQSLNIYEIFLAVSMDFITAYTFGLSGFADFVQNTEKRRNWITRYQSRHPYTFFTQESQWLTAMAQKVGIQLVPKHVQKNTEEMEAWVMEMCDKAGTAHDNIGKGGVCKSSENDYPLVYSQLRRKLGEQDVGGDKRADARIYSELCDHMIAGHETSGITLTYLAYELSRNPVIQISLRNELASIHHISEQPASQALPSAQTIDSLPLLNAIVLETFRLYPAIAGGQARVTPQCQRTKLGQYENIPGGIRVGSRASSLHVNPDVFPEPDSWRPQRWLQAKEADFKEMHRWMWVFGSGGRMCLGSHFAVHAPRGLRDASADDSSDAEIKLVTTFIYSRFKTEIVGVPDMRPADAYSANPSGGELVLKFEHVTQSDV
ncbi:MAG: hypothetical protein Q9172_005796 [Xanthocarpia lactea]